MEQKATFKITVTNNFHNTTINLIATVAGTRAFLTGRQVRRAKAALCGVSCCACGGTIGDRPADTIQWIDWNNDRFFLNPEFIPAEVVKEMAKDNPSF